MVLFQRLLRSRGAASALVGAAAVSVTTASTWLESSSPSESAANPTVQSDPKPTALKSADEVDFIGVFLKKDALNKLRERFPSAFGGDSSVEEATAFVVLKFQPNAKEREAFDPILGLDAKIKVHALAQDEELHTALVHVTTEGGEPIEFANGSGEFQHVVLSSSRDLSGLNVGIPSVLMERLRQHETLHKLLQETTEKEEEVAEWTGDLAEFNSEHLPLFNPFPKTSARVIRLPQKHQLTMDGVVCLASTYDAQGERCGEGKKAECGFCKFMKAGPCGQEFTAWEDCLNACKLNGEDFIEKCGKQTLKLRDCVDANPEYYHVLNESPEDDDNDDKKTAEEKAEAEQEKKKTHRKKKHKKHTKKPKKTEDHEENQGY